MPTPPLAFWLVFNPQGNTPPTFQHPSHAAAKAEAERLAKLHPDQDFYVMEPVGVARKVDVFWRDIDREDLPF